MEECGANGRHRARLVTQDPVIETTIDHGDGVEQRVVEDVDDPCRLPLPAWASWAPRARYEAARRSPAEDDARSP